MGFTAEKAISFDFDRGAHRTGELRRGAVVQVQQWSDVANLTSLVACQLQPAFQTKEAPTLFTPKTQPSTYSVLTAKITGKHTGVAVIIFSCLPIAASFPNKRSTYSFYT